MTWKQVLLLSVLCLQQHVLCGRRKKLLSRREDCTATSSCTHPQSATIPLSDRNCFCDKLCQLFDDCCADSVDSAAFYLHFTRARLQGLYKCMDIPRNGHLAVDPIYVINACPQSYEVANVKSGCEHPSDDDPLSLLPLSDPVSGLVFRNVFCAVCHQMYPTGPEQGQPLHFWQQEATCQPQEGATAQDDSSGEITVDYPGSEFDFEASREGLIEVSTEPPATLQDTLETKNCTISYLTPLLGVPEPRICKHHISTCAAPSWPSNAEGCSGPTDYVYTSRQQDGQVYRNKQCAMCNKEAETDLQCTQPPVLLPVERLHPQLPVARPPLTVDITPDGEQWLDGSGSGMVGGRGMAAESVPYHFDSVSRDIASPPSIRILLDMNTGYVHTDGEQHYEALQTCVNGVYDVYRGECRNLFCRDGLILNEQGQCTGVAAVSVKTFGAVNVLPSGEKPSFDTGSMNTAATGGEDLACPLVELEQSEYSLLSNGSVYVENWGAVLDIGEFIASSNQSIAVCSDLFNSTQHGGPSYIKVSLQSRLLEDYLSLGGQLLSLISLLIMFAVYIALEPLRNLPGKCLLSLALALFLAQLLFLLLVVPKPNSWPCWLLATATHYFFLAAFFWMNTMSFDIWRTFQWLSHTSEYTCCRFTLYSLYSWMVPLLLVTVALLSDLDYIPLPEYMRPHYAQAFCWLNNKWGLLIFFAAPIAVLLLINILFFILTVVNICHASLAAKFVSKGQRMSKRSHLVLYVKLTAVMGLTWIFGYLANSSPEHSQIMWYLFVVFNSLQGLIICIGFVCNRRVINLLREGQQRKKSVSSTTRSSSLTGVTSKGWQCHSS